MNHTYLSEAGREDQSVLRSPCFEALFCTGVATAEDNTKKKTSECMRSRPIILQFTFGEIKPHNFWGVLLNLKAQSTFIINTVTSSAIKLRK
jgi:hypothetical protein